MRFQYPLNIMREKCYDFALFSWEDDGPRKFNRIGEDDGLK